MNARRLGLLALVVTLVASGAYVFVYLARWEWNRALVSGVIFLAAELALVGALLNERLRALERRLGPHAAEQQQRALRALAETAPEPRPRFAWMSRPGQMDVFVPVLLGAGVVLSALAWLVERVARLTARPLAERALATRLGTLSLPPRGFLDGGPDPLELLRGPVARARP